MRALLGFSLFALMTAGAAGLCARAETYPTRPVTFVVPFAPGGGTEFLARLLGQRLEQRLGNPFVIENRPGGGGVIGALSVARAAPVGFTILMAPAPVMAINAALHKKLPYDPAVDFVPVALVVATPYVLVVAPSLSVQSVADLVELAKAKPGQLSFASAGLGTPHHLFAQLFKGMTGVEMTHVPYPGSVPAPSDLAAGHVQLQFFYIPPARNETQDATLLPNRARRAPRAGGQDWGTAMSAPLLSVRGVKAYYGHIAALRGVDVDVGEGEIVALIGANGAGKSTLMMTIFGNPRAREGRITFAGRDITQLRTHEIARLKIAQAPEGRRIFVRMTVMENLQMGAAVADATHFQSDVDRVFALFPRLKERIDQRGGTPSAGEQQILAIARALMGHPRLLLLDEPSLGLAPLIARQIFDAIRRLNSEEKLTVFLVEQNAFHALKLAHRGYVMVNGRITLSGSGRELLARPEVKAAYLEGGRH